MKLSLLFGMVKLIERCLVMVLVFASLVEISHPFGMLYLVCAIMLNFLGSLSIKSLSWTLFLLICLEYSLVLMNYTNASLRPDVPSDFAQFQQTPLFESFFHLPQ